MESNRESAAPVAIEPNTHSFIVKIWLEETAQEAGVARWRGHVTHVPSGDRHYVRDLSDVTALFASYLQDMKVRLGLRWRIWLVEGKLFQRFSR